MITIKNEWFPGPYVCRIELFHQSIRHCQNIVKLILIKSEAKITVVDNLRVCVCVLLMLWVWHGMTKGTLYSYGKYDSVVWVGHQQQSKSCGYSYCGQSHQQQQPFYRICNAFVRLKHCLYVIHNNIIQCVILYAQMSIVYVFELKIKMYTYLHWIMFLCSLYKYKYINVVLSVYHLAKKNALRIIWWWPLCQNVFAQHHPALFFISFFFPLFLLAFIFVSGAHTASPQQ